MTQEQLVIWLKRFKEYENSGSLVLGVGIVVLVVGAGFWYWRSLSQPAVVSLPPEVEIIASPSPSPTPSTTVRQLPSSIFVYPKNGEYYVEELPLYYIVQPGDTLPDIAMAFFKSINNTADIASANNLTEDAVLTPGQEILIPDVPTKLPKSIIEMERE